MNGRIILADHASAHPDGTFSLLRAGIDRLTVNDKPYSFTGALVARITSELSDEGNHNFEIRNFLTIRSV